MHIDQIEIVLVNISDSLKAALEADKQGQWNKAHDIVSSINHPLAFQIHAYLHRKEGDFDNALFWYGKAGVKAYNGSLTDELLHLETIITKLQK